VALVGAELWRRRRWETGGIGVFNFSFPSGERGDRWGREHRATYRRKKKSYGESICDPASP